MENPEVSASSTIQLPLYHALTPGSTQRVQFINKTMCLHKFLSSINHSDTVAEEHFVGKNFLNQDPYLVGGEIKRVSSHPDRPVIIHIYAWD